MIQRFAIRESDNHFGIVSDIRSYSKYCLGSSRLHYICNTSPIIEEDTANGVRVLFIFYSLIVL